MNINWGLFPDPDPVPRDKALRRSLKLQAADSALRTWLEALGEKIPPEKQKQAPIEPGVEQTEKDQDDS